MWCSYIFSKSVRSVSLMPDAGLHVTVWFHILVPQCPKCLILRFNWMIHNEIVYGEMFVLKVEGNTVSRTQCRATNSVGLQCVHQNAFKIFWFILELDVFSFLFSACK